MRDNWGDFIDFEQAVLLRARVPSKRINNEDASMYKLIRTVPAYRWSHV